MHPPYQKRSPKYACCYEPASLRLFNLSLYSLTILGHSRGLLSATFTALLAAAISLLLSESAER